MMQSKWLFSRNNGRYSSDPPRVVREVAMHPSGKKSQDRSPQLPLYQTCYHGNSARYQDNRAYHPGNESKATSRRQQQYIKS